MRVSEMFKSIQGEGLRMGHPSLFIRFFGCNFKCPGFGLPEGQFSTEPDEFAKHIAEYNSYGDLPLAKTGCDSYPSWHPKFRKFSPDIETEEVYNRIKTLIPDPKGIDLVITGGESLLKNNQNNVMSLFLFDCDYFSSFDSLTFETNCTQLLSDEFKNFLSKLNIDIIFSCSPKLRCSGVDHTKAIRPEILEDYSKIKSSRYLKFVVSSESDLPEVKSVINEYTIKVPVYLMPEGGTADRYNTNMKVVSDMCLDNGYIFSPRLHVTLYGNVWAK